jgi:hypothetical protein
MRTPYSGLQYYHFLGLMFTPGWDTVQSWGGLEGECRSVDYHLKAGAHLCLRYNFYLCSFCRSTLNSATFESNSGMHGGITEAQPKRAQNRLPHPLKPKTHHNENKTKNQNNQKLKRIYQEVYSATNACAATRWVRAILRLQDWDANADARPVMCCVHTWGLRGPSCGHSKGSMPDQTGPTLTMLKGARVRSETQIVSAGCTDEAAVFCIRRQCPTF